GHHDAAIQPLGEGSEVRPLGPPESDIEHVRPGIREPALQGSGELRARKPDVVADRDALRADQPGKGPPDIVFQGLIDLVRYAATDVVGFEGGEMSHGSAAPTARSSCPCGRSDPPAARCRLRPGRTPTAPR